MAANPLFAAGEFRGPLGPQHNANEWAQLKTMLADFGPDKSVDQWKHTWRDLKKKARADGGRLRLSFQRTGNAEVVPKLSTTTEKILGAMGSECATGIGVEHETGIGTAGIHTGELEVGGSQEQADAEAVVVAPLLPARLPVRASRPKCPNPAPIPTAQRRTKRPEQQQHSAAFVAAQRATNAQLMEIASELRSASRRQRRRTMGPLHHLKF
ncbi:uncharacterized protein LOC125232534 [Leguminivora glycinivorella]|uniref:uncharacterized protein LOC125232534 n=1 Tax=Leguminivora glycinivorella TaxID=1035111 RepID=UPI00200D9178|nr:uncharacterized protein LOC125232534 [Leguminivora glycinivorella]